MDSDQRRGSDLVRRYFVQLMEGCGRSGCPNRHCFSCVDGPGRLDRTQAALRSLELAQGNEHLLCDELPPFLHLTLVQRLVATALASNDPRPLVKEVAGVFSNADALNRSFLLCDAERKQMAAALSVGVDDTAGISTVAVRRRHRHRRPANAWACVRLRTAAGHRALHWWWGACRAPALSRSPPAPAAYPPAHPLRVHRASDAPPRHLRPRAIEPPPRAPSHPLAPPLAAYIYTILRGRAFPRAAHSGEYAVYRFGYGMRIDSAGAPTRVTCDRWCSGDREGLNSRSHSLTVC